MKILFLTKSKEYTLLLLKQMVENGHTVIVVCKDYSSFRNTEMESYCLSHEIKFIDNDDLYVALSKHELPEFDVAVSNTYGRLIKKELIDWLNGNIFNLHGAILPKYRGAFTYNWGLYNLEKEWGVTAHFVNEKFDEGDIICISKFPINPSVITVAELERKTQLTAYQLSLELLKKINDGCDLDRTPQSGNGRYYSRKDFENLKRVDLNADPEVINRKIHSCWCPPYEGAYIDVGDNKYFLIDSEILERI